MSTQIRLTPITSLEAASLRNQTSAKGGNVLGGLSPDPGEAPVSAGLFLCRFVKYITQTKSLKLCPDDNISGTVECRNDNSD
jgi:hypothetical protein